jgi:hypothetical protein
VAPEPKGSSPHWQQPTTGPCPPLHTPLQLISPRSILIPSSRLRLGLRSLSVGIYHQSLVHFCLLSHALYLFTNDANINKELCKLYNCKLTLNQNIRIHGEVLEGGCAGSSLNKLSSIESINSVKRVDIKSEGILYHLLKWRCLGTTLHMVS